MGNPLLRVCDTWEVITLKDKQNKIGIEKHIRITDSGITEQIDRIMMLPEYKTFNQIVNDALFYGLPVLCEKLFGEVELKDEPKPQISRRAEDSKAEEFYAVVVKLLRETVLNVTINKSLLASLFNAKAMEYEGLQPQEDFGQGLMSDTPAYLESYELDGLKKLRR